MADFIYALLCPQGEIRYIGKTNRPERRLLQHVSAARTGAARHHCARWIMSLLRKGQAPTMEVLYEVPEGDDWKAHEIHQIKTFKELGFSLTNIGEGGEGTFDMSPEAVAARVAKALITKSTPEFKEKIKDSYSRPWKDPEIRAKRLALMAEARAKPGYAERLSAAQIKSCARPEVKAAKSAAQKASYAAGGRINSLLLPCVRAKREAGIKERWAKPEERQKLSQAMRDPERQARMQKAVKSPEAKAKRASKMAVIQSDPEYLANHSAKAKAQWQDPEYLAKRKAHLGALHAATHTPEHLAMMRDRRNAKKREKRLLEDPVAREQRLADRRAAKKAALLAAATPTPYTESS